LKGEQAASGNRVRHSKAREKMEGHAKGRAKVENGIESNVLETMLITFSPVLFP
jgi:hypothetical protein